MLSSTLPELAGGGDRAAALRTLDSALQQKPGDSWLVIAQARVYMQLADFQRALGLLDEALAGSTSPADRRTALYYRGHAHFDLGQYAQAADDFDATLAGRTTLPGAARAAPVALRGAGPRPARRARPRWPRRSATRTSSEWPAPIAKFLLGKMSAGELEVAAETDEAASRTNGKCAAAFFIGIDAHPPRRQAARPRTAPAHPGPLPDRVGAQLGRGERAEAALGWGRATPVARHKAADPTPPHPEEHREAVRLEGWAPVVVLPTLRDAPFGRSSG